MRRVKVLVSILLIVAVSSGLAQNMRLLEFQVGSLKPKDTQTGLTFDAKYGIAVDEAVDISLGIGYFNKTYEESALVGEKDQSGQIQIGTQSKNLEYRTQIIPLTANATVHMPMTPPVGIYFGAGFTYQFLINKVNNMAEGVEETQNFRGGGWVARVGGEYQLGSNSSLIAELFYNACKVKGNEDKKENVPVWEEVNLTGMGFKVGLRMELY
jgi:hypothetical protein